MEFSVLISVYKNDNPEWFGQALDSLIDQELKPNEIIILIDGPISIKHEEIIAVFINRNRDAIDIHRLISDVNLGRGEILRQGVIKASHDFIAIMDADDISHKNRFKEQVEIFNTKEVDVVGSWVSEAFSHNLVIYATKTLPEKNASILKYAKRRNPINQMTVMFSKHAVISAGNYESFPLFEDMWLWCRMLNNGNMFYNIQKPLVVARAGAEMHRRRLGFKYAKNEARLLFSIYKIGFYSLFDLIINFFLRLPMRFLPICLYTVIFTRGVFRLRSGLNKNEAK